MRALMQKHKLVTFLFAWSAFTAIYLYASYTSARVHFEQYMHYASFAPEWKPRYVEIGANSLFWTMWVPKFPASGKVTFGEETFFVSPAENARLLALCKERNIPVHGSATEDIPYTEAALCLTPTLLAIWLMWRRREKLVHIKQLGCGKHHRMTSQSQAQATYETSHITPSNASDPQTPESIALDEAALQTKIKAMQSVHVFSLNSRRREFIKRL